MHAPDLRRAGAANLALLAFFAIAACFLLAEHRAHLLGPLVFLLLLVILISASLACQLAVQMTDQFSSPGEAIFRDDFSQPFNGLLRGTELPNGGISDYEDGGFRIYVNEPKLAHFSYLRYLENRLREEHAFIGTPIRLVLRPRH